MRWILPMLILILASPASASPPPAPSPCAGGQCKSPGYVVQKSVQTTRQVIVVTPQRTETRQRISRREVRRASR